MVACFSIYKLTGAKKNYKKNDSKKQVLCDSHEDYGSVI